MLIIIFVFDTENKNRLITNQNKLLKKSPNMSYSTKNKKWKMNGGLFCDSYIIYINLWKTSNIIFIRYCLILDEDFRNKKIVKISQPTVDT